MPFLLMLLLTIACLPVRWPQPLFGVGAVGGAVLTWSGVTVIVGAAAVWGRWVRYRLARYPELRPEYGHRQGTVRFVHLLALVALYGLSLYVFGWGWVVQGAPPEGAKAPDLFPGTELLVLAPFLATLFLSWACFYDAERGLHDALPDAEHTPPAWTRGSYVLFHLRHNLALVFVPVLLMLLVNDLPRLLPQVDDDNEWLISLVVFGSIPVVLACMPWVVRLVLGLRPLPDGALRERLERASARLRFRCSNILLWNTRHGVANAMVIGLVPFLRYVVLTDRLVSEMTPDEVEAVFGHEAGHVKHRHMPYYLLFLMVSLMVVSEAWDRSGLESLLNLEARKDLAVLPLVAFIGAYIFLVFGFLSRRCERQADLYGCRTVSCLRDDCSSHECAVLAPGGRGLCPTGIRTFIGALEKVALLNGMSRDRPGWLQSWQHSTIARRVEFLQRVIDDPAVAARFQRRVGLVKWALFAALLALLFLFGGNSGSASFWG